MDNYSLYDPERYQLRWLTRVQQKWNLGPAYRYRDGPYGYLQWVSTLEQANGANVGVEKIQVIDLLSDDRNVVYEKVLEVDTSCSVTITKEEHERLLDREEWLECLEAAGVDNWGGIEEACRLRAEGKDD